MTEPELKARIHSVESAGTVDGPGIRFVVFMQGCPFRCAYCHNPDTWDRNGGKEYTVEALAKEVLKYKDFFTFSKGGITVSGGEPLLYKKFLAGLFGVLKQNGIHTALDTTGFTALDRDLDALLDVTDLVLLDVKHLDPENHKKLTGQSNDKTFAFLSHLKKKKIKTWVRWVVVPELNDTEEYAEKFAGFIKQFSNVEKVELLPYHGMGEYKWRALGLRSPLEGAQTPPKEQMRKIKKILNGNGIETLLAE